MAAGKKDLEMLLVQSKIRETVRDIDGEVRVSDEFLTELNAFMHQFLSRTVRRCRDNTRKTLRSFDV